MGGLLLLVQSPSPIHCTKSNSATISSHCINRIMRYDSTRSHLEERIPPPHRRYRQVANVLTVILTLTLTLTFQNLVRSRRISNLSIPKFHKNHT